MDKKEPISTLKQLSCRKYSCEIVNLFLQGNNMLEDVASNIDSLLERWICLLTGPNSPCEAIHPISTLKHL
jgi:hypothetical protein